MKRYSINTWKRWIIVVGVLVLALSTAYTYYVTDQLAQREENTIELISLVIADANKESDNYEADLTIHSDVLRQNKTIPLLWVDERGDIIGQYNFQPEEEALDTSMLRKELDRIKKGGHEPFVVETYIAENNIQKSYIYYKNSSLLRLLSFFPLFQLLLIATFVGYGLFGFNQARIAEQNRVWAGLAKETAHQLGTPISAIMAWISLLETSMPDNDENRQVLDELNKDVQRLDLIAERFSKVGSKPELQEVVIKDLVRDAVDYMKKRASRQVRFIFDYDALPATTARINPPLFEWVVENLLRNALDAMGGKGNIVIDVYNAEQHICLDISDTGKGIPAKRFKEVFQPGFSTKKRGWGLGLSLAKRIINMYHKGRIYVKESKLNVGTTFTIQLPLTHKEAP